MELRPFTGQEIESWHMNRAVKVPAAFALAEKPSGTNAVRGTFLPSMRSDVAGKTVTATGTLTGWR